MQVFLYEKTLIGLLSAVFEAYALKIFPDMLLGHGELPPLNATGAHEAPVDAEKAGRVWRALRKKMSRRAFADLHYAATADDSASATMLFRYIRKLIDADDARAVENDLSDPDVLGVFNLARKVGQEKHKLMGFARFQKTSQGVYFAAIEPRYDIVPLLAGHFRGRFGAREWILYDALRRYGLYCDGENMREMHMDPELLRHGALAGELLDEEERIFRRLWKSYFSAAAIAGRKNPKLQERFMPRRFWKYLPEKNGI